MIRGAIAPRASKGDGYDGGYRPVYQPAVIPARACPYDNHVGLYGDY